MLKFLFRRHRTVDQQPKPGPDTGNTMSQSDVDALVDQGNRFEDSGEAANALSLYERAAKLAPDYWRPELNAGNALQSLGRLLEAARRYRRAIELKPDLSSAYLNLGTLLLSQHAFAEAAGSFRSAIRLRADWAEAWFGLGCALEPRADKMDAIDAYRQALRLDPANGRVASNLAGLLSSGGEAQAARKVVSDVLLVAPEDTPSLLAKAHIDQTLGEPESSVSAFRQVLAAHPDDGAAHSSYLFTLNFVPNITGEFVLAEHLRYGEMLSARTPRAEARTKRIADKRLRIGYVSPDFRRHSVSCFVEPLLDHHDRSQFEVYCYYNHTQEDEITRRFIALADNWRNISELSDAAAVAMIIADKIDILVDLAGHTTGNRLPVFACKPSPIQFTWLGYLCTTGIREIDYRLCDGYTDPAEIAEHWQVEKPLRLPGSQWCYRPQVELPRPASSPLSRNGHLTFGSFNQAPKLHDETLDIWSTLLLAVPDSRLRIMGINADLLEVRIRARFAKHGISQDRLDLIGRVPIESYFSFYNEVDIALDSYPYNGATTTCDALLMGVPVATICGHRSISRGGSSLLAALGLEDWVARSPDAFVPAVLAQIGDPERLATLRAEIPERMRKSSLMNEPLFTQNLEAAFRGVWEAHCELRSE